MLKYLFGGARITRKSAILVSVKPSLHFTVSGAGPGQLLLFHGYGQDASVFEPYWGKLTERYTIYSVDLFFHGKSTWNKGEETLEKSEWKTILNEFLVRQNITSFAVLGFSMGARFAMATMEAFPDRVTKMTLLAPDGIKTNFWYSLATFPYALRSLFKSMIMKQERFQFIASTALKLGLVDKGLLRFAEMQMDTEEKRNRVYYSWVVFRHLRFDMNNITRIINERKIPLTIYLGKFDKIITAKNMHGLTSKVKDAKVVVVEAGHNSLIGKVFSSDVP